MKYVLLLLNSQKGLFQRVQLTIKQYWHRYWFGAEQVRQSITHLNDILVDWAICASHNLCIILNQRSLADEAAMPNMKLSTIFW